MAIRILIADDHEVVRHGLKQILADYDDLQVVGEAANGQEVLRFLNEQSSDVILLDMSMPGRSGIELIARLKGQWPKCAILIFSMHAEHQYALRSLQAGASGYVTKDTAPATLIAAIRKVATGGMYITEEIASKLAQQYSAGDRRKPHERLSNREFLIFEMLVRGASVTTIAEALHLSVKTVSTHKARVLEKMGMTNHAELIRYAISNDLSCAHEEP
jgi:DNA-binding NarL/FixJ family response regulator